MRFLRLRALGIGLLLISSSEIALGATTQKSKIPPDAEALLKTFPGQAVSLPLVVIRATAQAEGFKQIQSQTPLADLSLLQAEAPLDWRLQLKTDWQESRNEQLTPFAPNPSSTLNHSIGLTKKLASATTLTAEIYSGFNQQTFAGTFASLIPAENYEARVRVGIAQKLWQDAFGSSTRLQLEAGRLSKEAFLLGIARQSETYIKNLIQVFYDAWLSKERVTLAISRTERQERLNRIMALKVKRGTAEEPDRLQVVSALEGARVSEAEAKQALRDRWYALVLTLKLPKEWLDIDPYLIPMIIDEPVGGAERLCTAKKIDPNSTDLPTSVRKARLEKVTAIKKLDAARSNYRSNLELTAGLSANGLDLADRSETLNEALSTRHPAWSVGILWSMPIEKSAEEIGVRQAMAEKIRAEAAAQDALDEWERVWLSQCQNLKRLKDSVSTLIKTYDNQSRRARLEEQRYGIGRTNIFNVIQASEDASLAELNLRQVQVSLRLTAWSIYEWHDGFKDALNIWAQNSGALQ